MRLVFAGLLLFTTQVSISYADYMDYAFEVKCDSAPNQAEIVTYAIWNTDVYSPFAADCTLANGRTVRVKMGLGPVYPYGMGGADPAKWLSVWVDQARVLSRIRYGCEDEGPCGLRIVVSTSGLEVCRSEGYGRLSHPDASNKPIERCEFTPNEKLSSIRDVLEFPSAKERARPRPGSLATLYAKDKRFCSQFKLLSQPRGRDVDNIWPFIGLPDSSDAIEADTSSSSEFAGAYRHYTFDINNDGKNESVVGLHARSHAQDGDTYFVYENDTVPNPVFEDVSEATYAKAATRILPHSWNANRGADKESLVDYERGDGAYRVKGVAAPWWDSSDKPIFRFRYWYLWPFRYKDSTYFLTWSQEADKRHWYTVLRPTSKYGVVEMCAFQIVQVRY
jgi:hypothetical protein